MKKLILIAYILFGGIILFGQKNTDLKLYADPNLSSITYSMSHPMHDWDGVSKDIKSVIVTNDKKDEIKQVAVTVKVSSFDSQNANRDSHCIEVTEALKYPNITFVSSKIEQNGNKLKVTGTLTFHGVSQLIGFDATVNNIKNKLNIEGGFNLNMTKFKIEPPSLLGVSTNEIIKLKFVAVY
jgi:polyisoprenoid-binding protein YceI